MERIKEMNTILQKIMDQSFTDEQGERFDPERFAELIVRECAGIAETAEPYQSSELIKKHFGVG
jgi:NTP pyrophosphatase (non-canonical NTP hydrolase)